MRLISTIRPIPAVLLWALVCLNTPRAEAALLGIDFSSGNLYDINQTTAAESNPRATGIVAPDGITFSSTGTLYALGQQTDSLYTINPTTGASTLVGATGLSGIIEGDLAFDPTTKILYGVQEVDANTARGLFTINTTTGAATIVANINSTSSDLSAMAFDASGNLLILDTNSSLLLRVNKATGAIISSVSLSKSLGSTAGMDFDRSTGTLYVGDGFNGTNSLYTLNTTTGVLTTIGAFNLTSALSGLAFTPVVTAVPEPASVILMGLGIAGLAAVKTFRRRAS